MRLPMPGVADAVCLILQLLLLRVFNLKLCVRATPPPRVLFVLPVHATSQGRDPRAGWQTASLCCCVCAQQRPFVCVFEPTTPAVQLGGHSSDPVL